MADVPLVLAFKVRGHDCTLQVGRRVPRPWQRPGQQQPAPAAAAWSLACWVAQRGPSKRCGSWWPCRYGRRSSLRGTMWPRPEGFCCMGHQVCAGCNRGTGVGAWL